MNELTIIIPCVSNIDRLPQFIDEFAVYLMTSPGDVDVIVVTNEGINSGSSVIEYVKEKYPWLKFEMLQRSGDTSNYGVLARFGLAYSTSRYIVFVSPYGEDDIGIVSLMLIEMRKGVQVVQAVANYSKADSSIAQMKFNIYRSIYHFITKCLLGLEVKGMTNSFKMFDRVFIQALGVTQNGYSICPEINLKTILAGGKISYICSKFRVSPIHKDFKLYIEGFSYLWLLFRSFIHRIGIRWF